jgi:GntR family transcriptional regulator
MYKAPILLKLKDKERGGPLYLQIASLIRQRVKIGYWKSGERLPTLNVLAKQFSVALVTVRQAIQVVEQDGLIWRKQGKGTFVSKNVNLGKWVNLETNLESLLLHLETKKPHLLQVEESYKIPNFSDKEGIQAESYRYMKRVHSSENIPYAIIDVYLDKKIYEMAPDDFDSSMIIPILESLPEINIQRIQQTICFSIADVETAGLLKIDINAPIGEVRRVILDSDGNAIYIANTYYRGDCVKLEVNFDR